MINFLKKHKKQLIISVVIATVVLIIAKKLRKPPSVKALPLQKQAEADRIKWKGRTETDPLLSNTLVGYWKGVGKTVTPSQVQSTSFNQAYPWSSAYVTHLIKSAGYDFKGGSSHSTYAVQGKKDRQSNTKNKFWAFRPSETKKVEIGDILVKNRGGSNYNYDTIFSGAKSHGDVVIDIKDDNGKISAVTQGGNLGDSVKTGTIPLTSTQLLPTNSSYFLQLKYV